MSQVLGYLLLAFIAAFLTYRQWCELRYHAAAWRAQRRPFRGVCIVLVRKGRPAAPAPSAGRGASPAPWTAAGAQPSVNGRRLQLVTTNYQPPTTTIH